MCIFVLVNSLLELIQMIAGNDINVKNKIGAAFWRKGCRWGHSAILAP